MAEKHDIDTPRVFHLCEEAVIDMVVILAFMDQDARPGGLVGSPPWATPVLAGYQDLRNRLYEYLLDKSQLSGESIDIHARAVDRLVAVGMGEAGDYSV